MGFGEELWDNWDDVMRLSDDHIKEMSHMREYLKEYAKLETKFATDMKLLAQKYQKPQKHSLDTFPQIHDGTSIGKAWLHLLEKTLVISGTHEEIAREITDGPVNSLKEVIKAQEKEKKAFSNAGQAKMNQQRKATLVMNKARDEYMHHCKSAERERQAAEQYSQAPNKQPDRVKQFSVAVQKAEKKVHQAKGKYEDQIIVLNKFNANHHTREMPQIFQQVEVAMAARINTMKQVISDLGEYQNSKVPERTNCIESIKSMAQSVSEADDLVSVCQMMHTGPMDFETVFEDFDPTGQGKTRKKVTAHKSNPGGRGRLSANNSQDFSRKVGGGPGGAEDSTKRLAEIDDQLSKCARDKVGVESLVTNYRENPSFGDVAVAEKQLQEIESQIRSLEAEREQLRKLNPGAAAEAATGGSGLPPGWVEALDDQGVTYYYREDGGPSQYEHPGGDTTPPPGTPPVGEDEFADGSAPRALVEGAKARAVYDFADEGDGLLKLTEGEEVSVVENAGDGWMVVANAAGDQGYVPEGYLESV